MPRRALRVIGDVHGDIDSLARALRGTEERFVIFLGDLVDYGPDSPGCLSVALDLLEAGRAMLLRSNHDDRLYRHYITGRVEVKAPLDRTLRCIRDHVNGDELVRRFCAAYESALLWHREGRYVFAHGAVDPEMLVDEGAPNAAIGRAKQKLRWLALYGEGRASQDASELPVRTYSWVDRIPPSLVAVVGHDIRSYDAPLTVEGAAGGRAIFLDTGCGKGGHLSWLDIPESTFGRADGGP